ncbi:cell envelope integrity EipB family protein [Alsobacter sp. SYSU M60028]|uniref:Cell envelope integrity EipB family protein n=1 Tax=Alsobacter ponti TaxID=2962936 RepID=A0ABT1LEJ1_9HYPH|nr:cell envelope integrity EipB family protein [Alsobacter ponti]MCP8939874.1 cell envelope integrity EipB family protein [Alsobacter ponti]
MPRPCSPARAGLAALLAGVALFAAASSASAGQAIVMAAHRATYDLVLAEGSSSGGLENARGRIVYEFTGSACEGYTVNFRQVTELSGGDVGRRVSDSRSSTFESADGASMRFNTDTRTPPQPSEATDGEARRVGGKLAVDLRKPERASVELKDAMFPTAQMEALIAAAQDGKSTLETRVYDGSEKGRKAYDTFAVIGKKAEGDAADEPLKAAGWDKIPRWPVSISYFEEGSATQQPAYVISFEVLENGVSRKLKLDYGDFSLVGDLKRLDVLKSAECAK